MHPRRSVARLYMKRQEGGRGLINVADCIITARRGLNDCMKESKEDMLSGALKEMLLRRERQRKTSQKGKGIKERRLYMNESYKDNV